MPISPARAAAFEILLRIENSDAYASELLHSERLTRLSAANHGLATELAMGVLRWRSALDAQLAGHISQKLAKFDREVITALRMGAYQLLFLDRIPAHAVINDSVELVKQARKKSAAGMVNAVLRKIGKAGFQPDPRLAHPDWLVDRWTKNFGREKAEKICEYDQSPPRTSVYAGNSGVADELAREGVQLAPGELVAKSLVVQAGNVTHTRAFHEHRLAIQDQASQLIAMLVGQGGNVLDCCAAPGGKARIIAEQNPQAKVVAMEFHPHRAALMKKLVHAPNVRTLAADVRTMPFSAKFEHILVDAPCSGTGTLARNPEIKWRLKLEDITRLQVYQIEILKVAMEQVAIGGRIVYATCSLEPEENEQVVEQALASKAGFKIVDCKDELQKLADSGMLAWRNIDSLLSGPFLRTIPGVHPCDGFFAAILKNKP